MFPHERSLVEKMKDEPFALVGVNSDPNKDELKPKYKEEKITWRSFWNGAEGSTGPIAKEWEIQGWPTLYLLDADGNIRKRWVGSPGEVTLDKAVDNLVAETKAKAAKDAKGAKSEKPAAPKKTGN